MSLEDTFQRIYVRAYDVTMVREAGNDTVSMVKAVKDPDLDVLYQALQRAVVALDVARDIFSEYARYHRAKLDGLLTLVERQQVEQKAVRNEVLAQMMRSVLLGRHQGVAGQKTWYSIESAPQKQDIRLTGQRYDGSRYIETGRWQQTKWSVENVEGHKAPTAWALLEEPPTEFRSEGARQ